MNPFNPRRRQTLKLAAALPATLSIGLSPAFALAQAYPNHPVTIVLPYSPGGSTDVVARVAANYLGPITKSTFIVENRPGASGTIAMGQVARATPDGYTLYMSEMTSTIVGALVPKLPFNPDTAFTPIAMIAETPYVLVINNNVPAKTLKEFVAYAKANPGKLNYGSGGVGSGPHIAGELFKSLAKLDINHVPYKGSGPALQDLMGGQIEMLITAAPTVATMTGKVRPLAVATDKRLPQLPDVPSAVEAGLPEFIVSNWFGLSAPRGTPPEVIQTVDAAVNQMLKTPEAVDRLVAAGGTPMYMGPADAQKKITAETKRWSTLIREAGIKNDNQEHTMIKITRIQPLHVGQFMFARVETDQGIVGFGEAGTWGHIEAAGVCIRRFAEYLEGKDAFAIEHHWNVMHRFSYFTGLAENAAISAIDMALWDIKGKALGVPIYELLGGAARTKARIYGHIYEHSIEKMLVECQAKMEAGFNAFGHLNPFLDEGHDQVYFKTHIKKMRDAIDNTRRMREVVGDRVDLLIEIHRRLTPAEAIVFARGIEDTHPMFIEDPIRPEGPDAMARVAEKIGIPIATGERFANIYEFQALMARGGVEYARVDLCLCGGITGARKVAAIAEAHHVQVVPHNPLSPIGLAACLQLDAAIPNFAIQEYATGFEAGIFESRPEHLGSDIVDKVPLPHNGFVDIPNGPGLGMNLLPDAQRIRPPLTKPISMRPHFDGFVVDQ